MKLISVEPIQDGTHKYKAVFDVDGRKKTTKFGAIGYSDYTQPPHDKEMRERYRTRHLKDLRTNDPSRAGFLSMFLLWGDSKKISKNLKEFVSRFDL